jgi:hypothetical protein
MFKNSQLLGFLALMAFLDAQSDDVYTYQRFIR